jgi:predicted nucleic acid-binding protein
VIYWDTSAAVKLYVDEPGSSFWREYSATSSAQMCCSALTEAEIGVTLLRKEVQGDIGWDSSAVLLKNLRDDIHHERVRMFPVGTDVLQKVFSVADECRRARPPLLLRTLDALHLATALLHGCELIATADERMKKAAKLLGLPLAQPST